MEQIDEQAALVKLLEILNKAAAIHNKEKVDGLSRRLALAAIDEKGGPATGRPFSLRRDRAPVY